MDTEVHMPQMGESIAEGTMVRWFKEVGEFVERDELLFEISTDKVDSEIPAPAEGYLTQILVAEGETVPVDTAVCVLSTDADARPSSRASGRASTEIPRERGKQEVPDASAEADSPNPSPQRTSAVASAGATRGERLRTKSSPLVRRLADEHGVDLSQLTGSGTQGRVTKEDLLSFLESRDAFPHAERVETMSRMRQRIAEHMVASRRTSAHVTSVFEVDMTRVRELRAERRDRLAASGVNLTYLAFVSRAVCDALANWPTLNASIRGDKVVYHSSVNLGIAVALENGLIVPVIPEANSLSTEALAERIQDVATRARAKELRPEEVRGGTFTITNPGVFGALIGTPIIHQPQVAILCLGKIEKRPTVDEKTDAIVARTMAYLSLTYDHRLIDGAVADQFLAEIARVLETGAFDETD